MKRLLTFRRRRESASGRTDSLAAFSSERAVCGPGVSRLPRRRRRANNPTIERVCGEETIKTDKYGFLIEDEQSPGVTANIGSRSASFRKISSKRWENMLDKAPKRSHDASVMTRTLKYYARRGLPDALRRKAWIALPGVDIIMNQNQESAKYQELLKEGEAQYRKMKELENAGDTSSISRVGNLLATIERDVGRTFPKHYLFRTVFVNDEKQRTHEGQEYRQRESDESSESNDGDENELDCESGTKVASLGKESADAIAAKKKMFTDSIRSIQQSFNYGSDDDDAILETFGKKKMPSREESEKVIAGEGQGQLRNLLRAYCIYDSEVGYCQGMNFISAMFLTFLPEEESFWLLVSVMNQEPQKLRHLFGEDMAGTQEMLYIAEKLLDKFLPELSKHMVEQGIHISMIVTEWLVTLYVRTFPFDLVARVWDCFLVEGWKVIYRVMLSLMKQASKDIMGLEFEQIFHYFRDYPSTVNGQVIMAGSLKIPLKSKHIQQFADEWNRHAAGV